MAIIRDKRGKMLLASKCHGREVKKEGRVVAKISDKNGKMRSVNKCHEREVREEGIYTVYGSQTERKEHAESVRDKFIGYVVFVLPVLESGRFMKILDSVYRVHLQFL